MAPSLNIYKREIEPENDAEEVEADTPAPQLETKIFGKHGKHLHKVLLTTTTEGPEGEFSLFIFHL